MLRFIALRYHCEIRRELLLVLWELRRQALMPVSYKDSEAVTESGREIRERLGVRNLIESNGLGWVNPYMIRSGPGLDFLLYHVIGSGRPGPDYGRPMMTRPVPKLELPLLVSGFPVSTIRSNDAMPRLLEENKSNATFSAILHFFGRI